MRKLPERPPDIWDNKTISRLDEGWLQSEKIHEYLMKHHDIGDNERIDDK